MCGGFVSVAAQSERPRAGQFAYHVGRLVTYVVLGVGAGAAGGLLDSGSLVLGVGPVAPLVAGGLLIVSGVGMLTGQILVGRFAALNRLLNRVHAGLVNRARGAVLVPLALGASSTLLPCGWLYTYVTVAGGTGSPIRGALLMVAFWAGTLPVLVTVGSLSRFIASPVRRYLPTLTAVLIIAAGFVSLVQHLRPHAEHHHSSHSDAHHSVQTPF